MRAAREDDAVGELIMPISGQIKPSFDFLGNCWGLDFEKPASAMALRTGKVAEAEVFVLATAMTRVPTFERDFGSVDFSSRAANHQVRKPVNHFRLVTEAIPTLLALSTA